MLSLPIPLFTALILAFLGLRAALEQETPKMVVGLIALCAGQSLLISLTQYYDLAVLAPVQPVTAMMIPALAYLTFLSTAVRPLKVFPDALHGLAPLLIAVSYILRSEMLDVILVLGFSGYGILLLSQLRKGPDGLPLVRLDNDNRAITLWRWMGIALIASAASDLLITVVYVVGLGWLRPWIISIFSSLFLLLIGLLNLSDVLKIGASPVVPSSSEKRDADTSPTDGSHPEQGSDDAALMEQLQTLMDGGQVYLDPNLSLRQMARKLTVPEKQLSAAINRSTGENVSRFINGHRIAHACALLQAGSPVTTALYSSGFNTKSNFNREFLRVKGCAPSVWLSSALRVNAD
ncbi:helix-turn-helix domain-containing protein [Roseibium sp.]|uniref:helix-turn-helix domain-containing protein n=1 Tax=Roseibium sp. TaxID=1936156 RepID=UPI003A981B27